MEENKQIELVAMQIILHAGNARDNVTKALGLISDHNYEEADQELNIAQEEMRLAHKAQTDIVQEEARGISYGYSVLFAHAQDTLMTIYSELNIAKQLYTMFKKLDERISKIENEK
ncbi:PTS lactose/cellobiose transporter subunit IIA [Anaerorhabdus sp.]|uniref:PTS lactose/cellobiose transporter subunit IIA n=1 Tax=Anaerorhabdus sp. TaxID=1872524 RepID=UPI002B1F7020|nr:PTS lactose/cellobiose transporter subunit IIA [Anaerorhabdus sp.]MEA4875508.1 PTS lactose/cellobiose transporter subunit IIA [Anaerorhabdus sp.]